MGGVFDLDSQFVFYAQYHNNFINQLIHIACVWPIFWTAIVMLWYTGDLAPVPDALKPYVAINVAFIGATVYLAFYLGLEAKNTGKLRGAGLLAAALTVICYITGGVVRRQGVIALPGLGYVSVFNFAIGLHVACWIAQFLGHGLFEGRSPALLDNLFQAIFMAPIFVILEALFFLGYKKEYRSQVQVKVNQAIAEWKASRGAHSGSSNGSSGKGPAANGRAARPMRTRSQKAE